MYMVFVRCDGAITIGPVAFWANLYNHPVIEMGKNSMAEMTITSEDAATASGNHPAVKSIEDVITFRLRRLVAIGDRAGHHWSERMFGLSLNEWRLLAIVHARGPARAGDVADLLMMDKSQTSRVIKALLSKDMIRNTQDTEDGRAIALEVTQQGAKLYGEMFAELMRSNERVLGVLTAEEVGVFNGVLGKLIDHNLDLLEGRLGRAIVR